MVLSRWLLEVMLRTGSRRGRRDRVMVGLGSCALFEDHVDLQNARASIFAYLTSLQSIRLYPYLMNLAACFASRHHVM
jgi:hypothetical protein